MLFPYAHIHRKSFVFYVQNVAHARLNVSSTLPLKWIKKRTIPQYHNQAFYYASVSRILENWIRSWFDYEIHAYFFTSKRLHMVVKSLCLFIFFRTCIYIHQSCFAWKNFWKLHLELIKMINIDCAINIRKFYYFFFI